MRAPHRSTPPSSAPGAPADERSAAAAARSGVPATGAGAASRRLLAPLSGACLLALAACGTGVTVDNSTSTASSSVPQAPSSSAASTSSSASSGQSAPASSPASSPAPAPSNPAADGGIRPAETLPTSAPRSDADKAYLGDIRAGGVDLSKIPNAGEPGSVEDQLIAAGRADCQGKTQGRPPIFTQMAAGQLQAQGAIPEADVPRVQDLLFRAAESRYCQ